MVVLGNWRRSFTPACWIGSGGYKKESPECVLHYSGQKQQVSFSKAQNILMKWLYRPVLWIPGNNSQYSQWSWLGVARLQDTTSRINWGEGPSAPVWYLHANVTSGLHCNWHRGNALTLFKNFVVLPLSFYRMFKLDEACPPPFFCWSAGIKGNSWGWHP